MGDTDKNGETANAQAGLAEDSALNNRLEELDAKLGHYRQHQQKGRRASGGEGASASGLAMAWRLGAEFIAGVLVGGLIGYAIDTLFGIAPWGLIIFILLGFFAGMLNMLRSAGKISPPGG